MEHKPKYKLKLDLEGVEEHSKGQFAFIDCPSCNSQVSAADMNLNDKIAKCGSCNAVFPIKDQIAGIESVAKQGEEIGQPNEVEKFYFGDELDLSVQQGMSPIEAWAIFLTPLLGLIAFAFYKKSELPIPIMLPMIFVLIFGLAILSLMNIKKHKTHIRVKSDNITVEHKPKKAQKAKHFDTRDVEQVYVDSYTDPMSGAGVFGLQLVIDEGNGKKHVRLHGAIKKLRVAKYMEQEIEKHLGLEDKPMIEEIGRV